MQIHLGVKPVIQPIRAKNFNCRSIYKNLFYALNYIIYGVKAWINKIKNDVNSFYGTKKGGLSAKIS